MCLPFCGSFLLPLLGVAFPLGILSRTCIYTCNEHISIEVYGPQMPIESCWLDISARADVDIL